MHGQSSSRVALNLFAVWREFFDSLRNVRLPDQQITFGRQAVAQVGALLLLDWAIVFLFVIAALAVASTGIEMPQPIDDDWTTAETILFVVVLGPPLEELIFRVWLTGERRAVIMFVSPWLLLAVLFAAFFLTGPLEMRTILLLSLGWIVSTIAIMAYHWRDRFVSQGFRRRFPVAFWLTSVLFGLSHIFNFEEPISIAAVLMIIPQFSGGLILGYVRVKYGMWSNITQHVTHNTAALALYYSFPDLPI